MKKHSILILATMLLTFALLASCGGGEEVEQPSGEIKPAFDGEAYTVFGNDAKSSFSVVYSSSDVSTFANLAVDVCDLVVEKGLPKPAFCSDKDKTESALELLIGDTNRALSAEAKAIVEENAAKDPNGKHWVWLYKNGQLAFYANSAAAYSALTDDLADKFFRDGVFKSKDNLKEIGHVEGPHDAYMSYEIYDNFYDGYTDPFGMEIGDYKKMVLTKVNSMTYRVSYADERGGTFTADFVQKRWGVWMMGAISYKEPGGTVHSITSSSTDYEFVLVVNGKGNTKHKSGNHGDYPKDNTWEPWIDPETGLVDPTSYYNDTLLDITFYDAKSGEKIVLENNGDSVKVNGLRIVEHHNVYEFGYKQENVLINVERSYLYNGYDIMCDSKLYMTQKLRFTNSYSAMLPISKQYGNCAMFYCEDGSEVYLRTPLSNTVNEYKMGQNATTIDLWGSNNPKYHMIVTLNNPEDQLRDPKPGAGYTGLREMNGGNSNKLYCSFFGNAGTMEWGEELHFNTCWSLSIQDDFKNPDREPDYWVGLPK